MDYEKAEQAVIEALDAGAASVDLEEKDVYRKPDITQDDEALNGKMAETEPPDSGADHVCNR